MSRAEEIRANTAVVAGRISAACARAGRNPADVLLVAVTKTFPASDVDLAIAAGLHEIGENRVQEARDKQPEVAGTARWHLIGHLQSNKARDAVRLFDVIQSVDSTDLAEKIGRAAASSGKEQEILLQVNIGREAQKSGTDPAATIALARRLRGIPGVRLTGLMAIPPAGEPEDARPYFRRLRALRDECGLEQLSMGMTDDFEVAVEEGATIVRVGRAIFGSR